MAHPLRAAIVGASTLLGKDLAERLNTRSRLVWDPVLLDEGDTAGQLATAGDEATLIQRLDARSFEGIDVAFFVGEANRMREHWPAAKAAGVAVVDLSGALENEPGAVLGAPAIVGVEGITLSSQVVVSAHPAALVLARVGRTLAQSFGEVKLAATVMEPASQAGSAGVDELQDQTVALLNFAPLPKEVYDTQVAFSLTTTTGETARVDLAATAATIRRHLATLGEAMPGEGGIVLQLVQAPVFHGYGMSVFVQLRAAVSEGQIHRAFADNSFDVHDGEATGTIDAIESSTVRTRLHSGAQNQQAPIDSFWLWVTADNLRTATDNALACAERLASLRPRHSVQ